MNQLNCESLVREYLLNKNPIYQYKLPISILISIFVFTTIVNKKQIKNSYMLQIIIPMSVLILVNVLINVISNLMLSKDEMNKMRSLCQNWFSNTDIRKHPILSRIMDLDIIESYSGQTPKSINSLKNDILDITSEEENKRKEYFTNSKKYDHMPGEEHEHLTNYVSDYVSDNVSDNVLPVETNKCLLNSSCNVLCSGEGNPCNLVAPIPGPQWQPQSAEAVQQRLINKDYTKAYC